MTLSVAGFEFDAAPDGPVSDAELIRRARTYLRTIARPEDESGQRPDEKILEVARQLKARSRFGYARRVLYEYLAQASETLDPREVRGLVLEQALCTYKDRDLPADLRYDAAIRLLEQGGQPLFESTEIEALGQAGSIYMLKWEHDLDDNNLWRSWHFYHQGYLQALVNTRARVAQVAWTGVNAAHALDLIAYEERIRGGYRLDDMKGVNTTAVRIRRELIERLTPFAERDYATYSIDGYETVEGEKLIDLWRVMSTLGEAYLGLAIEDPEAGARAKEWFDRAGSFRTAIPMWHFHSTTRRIATVARVRADRRSLLADPRPSDTSDAEGEATRETLRLLEEFVGKDRLQAAVESAVSGKVGLALSGGGLRASFFHLGVLARLAEMDWLRRVEVISCVSGGAILGACYYLKLRRLLESHSERELDQQAYITLVEELCEEFLAGAMQDIRMRIVANLRRNLRMLRDRNYTHSARAAELIESILFKGVDPRGGHGDWLLRNIYIRPPGEEDFHPRLHNWLRLNKVPMLIVNASTLNTGHNWQFTGGWMGEPPWLIAGEVDANHRLRRVWLRDAPSGFSDTPLSQAVAASASVPGVMRPISFSGLHEDHVVRLTDGGVFDNQGIGALLDEDCSTLLISDASGQMTTDTDPGDGPMKVSVRANDILMQRVRQVQFEALRARQRAGMLRKMMFVHLTKDLSTEPVGWMGSNDPVDDFAAEGESRENKDRTPYGIHVDAQRMLSNIRTDLDSFSEIEAYSLMTSGYRMADSYAPASDSIQDGNWAFLRMEKYLTAPKLDPYVRKVLDVGSVRWLKYLHLLTDERQRKLLRIAVAFVALPLAAFSVWTAVPRTAMSLPLEVVAGVPLAFLVLAAVVLSSDNLRDRLPTFLIDLVLGSVGWLAAVVYLRFFNQRQLDLGAMSKLSDEDQ